MEVEEKIHLFQKLHVILNRTEYAIGKIMEIIKINDFCLVL